jgi:nucleotide-binding universal stress UspA family protein
VRHVPLLAPAPERQGVVPYLGEAYAAPQVYDRMLADVRAHAQRELDTLVAKAKASKIRTVGLLHEGIAHDRIVRTAKARRADLLVIGTHGRTGFARLFLGSVASRVIAGAPCPVLTVRGK